MRHICKLSVLCVLATWCKTHADDNDVKAIIDKAIQAVGGVQKLNQLKAATWKTRGLFYDADGTARASEGSLAGELPDKFRLESKNGFVKVIVGDKGWSKRGGQVTEMDEKEIARVKSTFYHKCVATTLLPLRDKENKITPLGRTEIDDRTAIGIRVARKGHQDLKLFFDADTGLLLKSAALAPGSDKETSEIFWSDHKSFGGIIMAGRIMTKLDGKLFSNLELTEFHQSPTLAPALFEKK